MQEALKLIENQIEVETKELRILKRLVNEGTTVQSIADAVGKSRSLISTYLNGSYKSPKDKGQHIEVFLRTYFKSIGAWDEDEEGSQNGNWIKSIKELGIIETGDYFRVRGIMNSCRDNCEMRIIISAPGLGKSFTIENYSNTNDEVIVVECDGKSSEKTLLVDIAESLNINSRGSAGTLMNRVCKYLRKNPHLIVFDEADLLKHISIIEMIRRLYDKSKNIGVVLVGNMRLAERLITVAIDDQDYARISDRIGWIEKLEGLTPEEAGKFVERVHATDAARWLLTDIGTNRGIRQLIMALKRLLDVTKGKIITEELVQELGQIVLSFNA